MSASVEAVRHLAAMGVGRWFDPAVIAAMDAAPSGQPLIVACSGGADSVFLLLLTVAYAQPDGRPVRVAHFNHRLRGEEAQLDAGFVSGLASELGCPFLLGEARHLPEPNESSLRDARYAWLNHEYRACGAAGLLLGHHADDAAESLLMAALSGAGLAGLAAPRAVNCFTDGTLRLRPLLAIRRTEIEAELRSFGLEWRTDATNWDSRYTRNWLRAEVLPMLHARFPQDIIAGVARTRELVEEALVAIDSAVEQLQLDFADPCHLPIRALRRAPRAVARRAVMRWWLAHHAGITFPKNCLDELLDQLPGSKPLHALQVSHELLLRIDEKAAVLHLVSMPWHESKQWVAGIHTDILAASIVLPDGARLAAEKQSWTPGERPYLKADPEREAWVISHGTRLYIRQWQAGDRYRPLGSPGRRKLQDMFTDAKWSRARKLATPVICDERGRIIWVPGFPPEQCVCVPVDAESALKLTYQRHLSRFEPNYGGQS